MKKFHAITEESIAKCVSVGINADQLDELVESSTLECNALSDVLHTAHKMIADNQEQGHLLSIPKEQLRIVSDAIKYYRENAPIDDHAHFDTYSLEQLFSGDYSVDVNLTDNNSQFGLKSGVDIPEFVDDDEPTGSCPACAKYIYDSSEYCDATCRDINYAKKHLSTRLLNEVDGVQKLFIDRGNLYIEFANGMCLQIHDNEINYQAFNHLESEIEGINN